MSKGERSEHWEGRSRERKQLTGWAATSQDDRKEAQAIRSLSLVFTEKKQNWGLGLGSITEPIY